MESFWGTLKNELIYHNRYTTRREAMQEIKEYIEIFYNRQRKQARLNYLSPAVFEWRFDRTCCALNARAPQCSNASVSKRAAKKRAAPSAQSWPERPWKDMGGKDQHFTKSGLIAILSIVEP